MHKREVLTEEEQIKRIKKPEPGQLYAVVTATLGAGKLTVDCSDGKTRLARIPGKMRKRIWIRIGDIVLVRPWEIEPDTKCDVEWRYTPTQANHLKKTGVLKNIDF